MKESKNLDKLVVFRERFIDEQTTRANFGIPTAVTFSKGIASFNGTSSIIDYGPGVGRIKQGIIQGSIRLRVKPTDGRPAASQYIVNRYKTTDNQREWGIRLATDGTLSLFTSADGNTAFGITSTNPVFPDGQATDFYDILFTFSGITGALYVNGVSVALSANVVPSSIFLGNGNFIIGAISSGGSNFSGDIDLVEMYNTSLTAEDAYNLANNRRYKNDKIDLPLLMDLDSTQGFLEDKSGLRTFTTSDVSIVKDGSIYSANFNGDTSYITAGSDFIGTENVTVNAWVKAMSYGESDAGAILRNGKFDFYLRGSIYNAIRVSSDGSVTNSSGPFSGLGNWRLISFTRTSAGIVNTYLNGVQVGSVNSNSGTPVAGSTIYIGNYAGLGAGFRGRIATLSIHKGIMTTTRISQIYSSQKLKYNL